MIIISNLSSTKDLQGFKTFIYLKWNIRSPSAIASKHACNTKHESCSFYWKYLFPRFPISEVNLNSKIKWLYNQSFCIETLFNIKAATRTKINPKKDLIYSQRTRIWITIPFYSNRNGLIHWKWRLFCLKPRLHTKTIFG